MADRIMAALDYLDAHSAPVLLKQKQHPLGDVDSKYDLADTFELPFHALIENSVVLSGTSRTNLSREKTIDQILDEDRARLVQNVHRTKSASAPKTSVHSRPHTSLSSGSAVYSHESRRRPFRASSHAPPPASASRTSTKKLTFTSPGVNVGPTDARDEVMEEIANKPLTHSPTKDRKSKHRMRTAGSAPALGQHIRDSVSGARSMTSLSRSKTFHSKSRQSESEKYEVKPGPFATVKVSGADMWVVSSSTPTSYFNGELPDQNSTKEVTVSAKSTWEDTANSVPHEEKKSPPRHERQLGAPPQFGPTHQWYSFSGGSPSKQRPVLTAFADETDDEYYSIESHVGRKVVELLEGSPGIRIGVNGHVIAKSMKVGGKQEKNEEASSCSDMSDDNNQRPSKGESEADLGSEQSGDQDLNADRSSSGNGDKQQESICTDPQEDRQFSLIRYLGIAKGENPYVVKSSSETTSSTDVASILNNLRSSGKANDFQNDQEKALWKALEGASPNLWVSKEKLKKIRFESEMKKELARKMDDNPGPLSWQEQLQQENEKVLEANRKPSENSRNSLKNGRVPVVFNKLIDYEHLPNNFVHLTSNGYQSHSAVTAVDKDLDLTTPTKGYSATISAAPKNRRSPKDLTSSNESLPLRPFTSHEHRREVEVENRDEDVLKSAGVDVSDIMSMSPGHDPAVKLAGGEKSQEEDEPKNDDVSKEELEAIRIEAAYKMKMTGRGVGETEALSGNRTQEPGISPVKTVNGIEVPAEQYRRTDKSVTLSNLSVKAGGVLATVDIRPSKPRSSVPVNSLNLSEMGESCSVVNGSNPSPPQSARPRTASGMNNPPTEKFQQNGGQEPPLNTPKTPVSHHYYYKDTVPHLSPKQSEPPSPTYAGNNLPTEASSRMMKRASKSASFVSRSSSVSPRSSSAFPRGGLSRQSASRPSEGFAGLPLSSKSSGRQQTAKFVGGALKASKTGKPSSPPSIIPHGNTYADVITKSGFIQISQPIHISPLHHQQRSASGNKMYDSYMRELSARSERTAGDGPFAATEKSNVGLVGKRLGGSSCRLLPEYFRRTRQHPGASLSKVKRAHPGFASLGGRRSGLAITSEQQPRLSAPLDDANNLGLGLQGGQLRLNLDKNIHVIYRDLGIPKKTSKPSSASSSRQNSKTNVSEKSASASMQRRDVNSAGQRSDSVKSRPLSALSATKSAVDPPVTATDPPDPDLAETLKIDVNVIKDQAQQAGVGVRMQQSHVEGDRTLSNGDQHLTLAPPAAKALHVEVVDSGTQWSPHEPLHSTRDREPVAASSLKQTRDVGSQEGGVETNNPEKQERVESAVASENVDRTPPSGDTPDVAEGNSLANQGRSTSDSRIDLIGQNLSDRAENTIVDDETVRGVTKVTVNIAISGDVPLD